MCGVLVGLAGVASAAPLAQRAWVRAESVGVRGAGSNDYATDLAAIPAGGVVVTGMADYEFSCSAKYVTQRVNASGQVLWRQYFDPRVTDPGCDGMSLAPRIINTNIALTETTVEPPAVVVDPARGAVYVVGQSSDPNYYNRRLTMVVIAYDLATGQERWIQRYRTPGTYSQAYAKDVCVDAQGNVLVTGVLPDADDYPQVGVLKLSPQGGLFWAGTYADANGDDGQSFDQGVSITTDAQQNVIVGGDIAADWWGDRNAVVLKLAPNGTTIWAREYAGDDANGQPATDLMVELRVDAAGNVVAAGNSNRYESTWSFVRSYSPQGALRWTTEETLAVWNVPALTGLALDVAGNPVVVGTENGQVGTAKLAAASGALQWRNSFVPAGAGGGSARDVALDAQGRIYVTGEVSRPALEDFDPVTRAYTPQGVALWTQTWTNQGDFTSDAAVAVGVDNARRVYIAGRTFTSLRSTSTDYLTIMYRQFGVIVPSVGGAGPIVPDSTVPVELP